MKIEEKIKKIIKKSDNVFVSGHKCLDLDALGSCIGIKAIASKFKRECFIIIDDEVHNPGISKLLNETKETIKTIKSSDIPNLYKKNSVLVIVDTNKTNMIQNDKILHYFNNIIVIDHHQETDQTINGINMIDTAQSSACEMISTLTRTYNVELSESEATAILSGIVLDTHDFSKKATANTFYEAYYLTELGANIKKVQYYLKENLNDYIIRNKVIMNVEVINKKYAVSVADSKVLYKREDLAKIADTLLNFNDIEASFVLGNRVDDGVGISARSEGSINVDSILEELGGGGDNYNAACLVKDMNIKEVKKELIRVLSEEE